MIGAPLIDAEFVSHYLRHLPHLETERLILRPILPQDAQPWFDYTDYEATRFTRHDPFQSVEAAEAVISRFINCREQGLESPWTVVLKSSLKMVGLCGFSRINPHFRLGEIGFGIAQAHWGSGFATESTSALIRQGFDVLKLHRIEAHCSVENIASKRVLEKAGMRFEGVLRERLPIGEGFHDMFSYAILETD